MSICSCGNKDEKKSFNGHWHFLSNSQEDDYYFTIDIDDSVSTINKYDISRNLYDCKRIVKTDNKWILQNEMFYNYELSLENGTLIIKNDYNLDKCLRVENTIVDRTKDAFSSIFLDIELGTSNSIELVTLETKYFSPICIGKIKKSFKHTQLYTNKFSIQCRDQLCSVDDIEQFISAEIENNQMGSRNTLVLINMDKETPNELKEAIIEKVTKYKDVIEIYFSYVDKEMQSIVYEVYKETPR